MAKLLKRIKTQNIGNEEKKTSGIDLEQTLKLTTKFSSYSNLDGDTRRKSLTPDASRFQIFSKTPIFADFLKELNAQNVENFHEFKDFYDVSSFRGSASQQNDRVILK